MNYKKTQSFKSFINSKYYCSKHTNYFNVYDDLFSSYKNKKITFVDIGVFSGGSLFMWKKFFGKRAKIIGVELNPIAKQFEKYGFNIFIGDQSCEDFWSKFFKKVGKVDIVLDDGGHTNLDQIITVVSTVNKINDGGILVIEDTSTSYVNEYNSSKEFSFIEFTKKRINNNNSLLGSRWPRNTNTNILRCLL